MLKVLNKQENIQLEATCGFPGIKVQLHYRTAQISAVFLLLLHVDDNIAHLDFFSCVCKRFWRSVERIKSGSRYRKCTKQGCLWPEFALCINEGRISMQVNIIDFSSGDATSYISQGRCVGGTIPLATGEAGRAVTAGISDPRRKEEKSHGYCRRVLKVLVLSPVWPLQVLAPQVVVTLEFV